MDVWTHLCSKWKDRSGYRLYADDMMELDDLCVGGGKFLKNYIIWVTYNTIVVFTSDKVQKFLHGLMQEINPVRA